MSEVAIHQPQQSLDLQSQMDYSKALASASIIPPDFRGSPANILVAIGYAQALGEHPIVALTDVYIVKGRPSMSAAMMHRRALEAGHRVRVVADEHQATASVWRRDDPSFEHKSTWTIDRAKAAGIAGSDTWKKFTSAMLRSRAISEVCRLACPEVLGAVKYTPDEIGGKFADDTGAEAPAAPSAKVSRRKPAADPTPEPEPEVVEAEVVNENAPTPNQVKRMWAGLTKQIDESQHRAFMEDVVGHPIESPKNLTRHEVAAVIDRLENGAAA